MSRVWEVAPKGDVAPLVEKLRVHPAIAQCLLNRGIGLDDAESFVNVTESYHSPFSLPDIEKAVDRLKKAKERNERVVVYRDYDVDGAMGGTILVKALQEFGLNVTHFAPNRFTHGYGLHISTIDHLAAQGAQLIVTVDCGITSVAEVEHARTLGIDVIVTDHHEPGETLPDTIAVINPKRKDSKYPFKEICGAAIAWKLAQVLLGKDCKEFLDLVTVATVADVVPLMGENRVIVRYGLEKLNSNDRNLGIDRLAKVAGLNEIDSFAIGFGIGPRINAIGRLGDPNAILELFLTDSQTKAEKLATIADQINKKRQELVDSLAEHAEELVQSQWKEGQNVIVLASEAFHEGVIGIVAARILEKYQRPTILIALEGDKGKASCRSLRPLNIHEALTEVKEHLLKFGGHEMAAGFSIEAAKVDSFRTAINKFASKYDVNDFQTPLLIDAVIDLEEVDDYLVEQMRVLAPFGEGNPAPCFMVERVKVTEKRLLSDGKHVRLNVFNRVNRTAIGFNFGPWVNDNLPDDAFVDLAFRPNYNEFKGQKNLQLEIVDIRLSDPQVVENGEENVQELDSKALAERLFGSEAQRSRFEDGKYDGIERAAFFHTKVAGVSFENRQEVIKTLKPGDVLYFRREPEKFLDANGRPLDENAISVYTEKNEQVGFLNRRLAAVLAPIIDSGESYIGMVDAVTGDEDTHKGLNIIVQRVTSEFDAPHDTFDVDLIPKQVFPEEDDPMASQAMQEIRKSLIGDHNYHAKQEEAIRAALDGEDIMVVMGTGRGKSAIFQSVAAYKNLMHGKKTLIVYPIKALLNDQYHAMSRKLSPLGIQVSIASGALRHEEKEKLFDRIFEVDVLLATPEFILYHQEKFQEFLDHTGLVVIDECHHLSDDRSGYRQISKLIEEMKDASTMLLSATIDDSTLERIQREIHIDRVIIDDFARTNLKIVDHRNQTPKEPIIWSVVDKGEKVVIYCNSRAQTVLVAEQLRHHLMRVGRHNEVAYYNADLDPELRLHIEKAFARGDLKVIVATSAFGEGIDIPDIRHVIHYHLPLSLTAFMQQSGRAGRDGKYSEVHLLFGRVDERINRNIIEGSCPSRETLTALLKSLVTLAGSKRTIRISNAEWQEAASKERGEVVSLEVIETALRIFEDLRLIRIDWSSGRVIHVQDLKTVSLHDAVIYSEALRDRRAYEDYVEWLKEAAAEEIEKIISRPLFPTLTSRSA